MRGWSRRENKYSGLAREVHAEPQVGPALCVMLGFVPIPCGLCFEFFGYSLPGTSLPTCWHHSALISQCDVRIGSESITRHTGLTFPMGNTAKHLEIPFLNLFFIFIFNQCIASQTPSFLIPRRTDIAAHLKNNCSSSGPQGSSWCWARMWALLPCIIFTAEPTGKAHCSTPSLAAPDALIPSWIHCHV